MICFAQPTDLPAAGRVEVSAATVFDGTQMDFAANDAPNDPAELLAAIGAQLMWVAIEASQPIGFVFAKPCAESLYVRELSVAAPHRQQGHGSKLIQTLIAAARRRGHQQLILTTDRGLPWNAPFYKRLWFKIIKGAAIPATARNRLQPQFVAGFDRAHRCAMVMPL